MLHFMLMYPNFFLHFSKVLTTTDAPSLPKTVLYKLHYRILNRLVSNGM